MNHIVQQVPGVEVEKSVDVARYLDFIADNRGFIAVVALLVTLLGAAYAFVVPPVYKANLLIKVEDSIFGPKNTPGDVLSPEVTADMKAAVASEMEVIRSRAVVTGAVGKGKFFINVKPKYFPLIGQWIAKRNRDLSDPGIFGFGGYVWGAEQATVTVFNVPESLEGKPFVLRAEEDGGFTLTEEEEGLELKGKTGELRTFDVSDGRIEVQIEQLRAKPGAEFSVTRFATLETVEKLQEAMIVSQRGKQSGIIDVALEGTDPVMASNILNEIGQEYIRLNVSRRSSDAEKTLAFLNNRLPELKQELERTETKYNQLRNNKGTVDIGEETRSALQQSLQTQTKLVELAQRREELLMRFLPNHPNVENIDQQMATLRREAANVEAKLKKIPDVEQNVLRLNRDVQINTEMYTSLLAAAQQLRIATESKVGTVRLLDNAVVPIKPVKPKKAIVIALSGMLGLILGLVAAFARKSVFGRIDAPHEIEQRLGLPIAATIPHSPTQEKMYARLQSDSKATAVLPLDVPSDGTVESLRRFRSSLQFAMLEAKNNVVMISGATPGVGKSFVSANFAAVLASIGKKVLLIDGDMRSGHLHMYFGRERGIGLSDVITGNAMFGQAIQKGVAENVDFLSTGELPKKPAELLAHENFAKLLQLMSTRYDYVLVDTAPVLPVSDALVVAAHVGAIFNVVRGGVTTTGEIEEAVKRLNQSGHTVTGIVFNDLKQRAARYEYGYQYERYLAAEGRA
ncbi:polysaccharide biosynthesis tyrosine autokinase [Noviherbaspirillum sp. ST9]|uniref:polysaccharide biosynthesis tyrosine autokinase n=1 Tax=Noviherbaspirillum sp. ST9 TaxID=3401606 RepID=UPI003B588C64